MKKLTVLIFACLLATVLLVSCDNGETGFSSNSNKNCTHAFDKWVVTKEPACVTEGAKERSCFYCSETMTASIEPTGHLWVDADHTTCSICGVVENGTPSSGEATN